MILAHKIALDPNDKQRSYFMRASGTARFAYNWALGEWRRQYQAGEKPSEVSLRRQLNALKREQYRWMFDVTKCAAQEAVIDLGAAFRGFFEKRGAYPRFKKKGVRDSFCAANETGTFRCDGKRIKLPVIGWVRLREAVRFCGPLKRVTVSREADRWFASVSVEMPDLQPVAQPIAAVGVDLGITTLATLSQGEPIAGPKAHTALLKRLRRSHRALSRKRRGSRNAAKARGRLARLHARIACIRKDAQGDDALGQNLSPHRYRGFECARHGAQSLPCPRDHGWQLFRVSAATRLQGQALWRIGCGRRPVVSFEQDLFLLRFGQGRTGVVATAVALLGMWVRSRPRLERGEEP